MKYVADTHALLWHFTNDSRLGKRVAEVLKEAEQNEHELFIPSIVLLEAMDIGEKKKVRFQMQRLFDFLDARQNFTTVPLDTEWLRVIAQTGKGLELHDRVIATVAQSLSAVALTKDSAIRKTVKTIW